MDTQDSQLLREVVKELAALKQNHSAFESSADEKYANVQALDVSWLVLCGAIVFFMQAGFSMLEVGAVRSKNHINILYKNIMDGAVAAIGFWMVGYMFAYGKTAGGFVGIEGGLFFCQSIQNNVNGEGSAGFESWFFQWTFAGAASTIVSGSVAERMKFEAYLVVSFFITCFIYPIAVHWVWGQGFLSAWGAMPDADGKTFPLFSGTETSRGMVDFAGSGCVHMIGGVAGLMGAIMLGPRKGRFVNGKPVTFPPSNQIMMALGTMILWFGWYGFNCGSTLVLSGNAANVAAKVAFTTTISASSGCLTMTLIARFFEKYFDIGLALNGILAGLVSITASCAVVNSWHAFIIGMIGAFVVYGASKLLLKLQIDDPLDAFPVHGCCGLWGVIATGIFCTDKNVAYAGYPNGNTCNACSTGEQLGVQIVGALVLFTWSAVTSGAVFLALKLTMGIRVSEQVEDEGMDISEHGACVWVCCFVCIFMP
mmetsp:Transcript_86141/g.139741  ORF Transcript_86141/g.139741 Transcript_86141/m.139741 type:complete len:482 (+) Transcript_86141:17-1462(+)